MNVRKHYLPPLIQYRHKLVGLLGYTEPVNPSLKFLKLQTDLVNLLLLKPFHKNIGIIDLSIDHLYTLEVLGLLNNPFVLLPQLFSICYNLLFLIHPSSFFHSL